MNAHDLKIVIQKELANPLVKDFQTEYLNARSLDSKSMIRFLFEKNYEGLFNLAHQWIGNAEPYGFHELSKIAKKIESYKEEPDQNHLYLHQLINLAQYYLELKKDYL